MPAFPQSPAAAQPTASAAAGALPDSFLRALSWRGLGPSRGGRATAVVGLAGRPLTYYFASAGGGVWKTVDGGGSWRNVSDRAFGGAVGALAVSPANPDVLYAGGGERLSDGEPGRGAGLWKSTDGGETWQPSGLENALQITRIALPEDDPERIFVAVEGDPYRPQAERGVYRSTDGGGTWRQVLSAGPGIGAVDLALGSEDPAVLYACLRRSLRAPWGVNVTTGSGLWKSTDGGDSWTELSGRPGLPGEATAPIFAAVAVSPTNPRNVYTLVIPEGGVESSEGGIYRSTDGGETWSWSGPRRLLSPAGEGPPPRIDRFSRLVADPGAERQLYLLADGVYRSTDGGESVYRLPVAEAGVDQGPQDLWLAPEDPQRLALAADGGAAISHDGGRHWTGRRGQPTARITGLATDREFPYRIYAGQKGGPAVRIRHLGPDAGEEWQRTAGGPDGMALPQPGEPEIVFGSASGGRLMRYDHRTGLSLPVTLWPEDPAGLAGRRLKYRFHPRMPLAFSPHDDEVLYAGGNLLFMTTDDGQSWQAISPDLTRRDARRMGRQPYAALLAILESPFERGVFWTGSDDGLVHLSRDYGATWVEVTPPQLPPAARILSLEPHPERRQSLYLAAAAHESGDERPYLLRTDDYGRNWTLITQGIPPSHTTFVLRADPRRPGLLFAGTSGGVYVSLDDGGRWQSLRPADSESLRLPETPVVELVIHGDDLVAGTWGRGVWVLDDLSPLRQVTPEILSRQLHLMTPRQAWRLARTEQPGWSDAAEGGYGAEPFELPAAAGARIHYLVGSVPEGEFVQLEILEADGTPIRSFAGDAGTAAAGGDSAEGPAGLTPRPGLNQFVWDLRYPGPPPVAGLPPPLPGPQVLPGNYLVRLTVGEDSTTAQLNVVADPRSGTSREGLEEELRFLTVLRDSLVTVRQLIEETRQGRQTLERFLPEAESRAAESREAENREGVEAEARRLAEGLAAVENALIGSAGSAEGTGEPARLLGKLRSLAASFDGRQQRPTEQALAVSEELRGAVEVQQRRLRRLLDEELPRLVSPDAAPLSSPADLPSTTIYVEQ